MDMKSISQKLQDDIRAIMEANLHPNQQKIDVHEPEKDEITAHDFKKLRAMKKDQHGKITKEDTDSQIQELTGMAAQQAAVAISLIKAGKKDGKMPKPMKETAELEETKGAPKGHHFTKSGQLKRGDADQDGHGGPMLRTDPKDKMRNKIPPVTEEDKKVVSPFDYKNYTSQIPKKPGELTGHDSKKISTGTVYTKKPVKEESHQSATTMKHIPNASPAMKKAAKDIKPGVAGYRDRIDMLRAGGVKEETQINELSKSTLGSYLTKKTSEYMKGKTQPGSKEHAKDVQNMGKAYDKLKKEEAELDEAYQTAKSEFVARQGRLTAAAAETEKDPARLKRMSSIPGYSAAMDLAKKTTQGAKHTKEEVEQMDELSTSTLKSYISGAQKDRASQTDSKNSGDREQAAYAKKQSVKRTLGIVDAKARLSKEEVEQEEYTFADYLDAVRTQYGDEDAVLIANEAFKNQDITLFIDQSQSPEA